MEKDGKTNDNAKKGGKGKGDQKKGGGGGNKDNKKNMVNLKSILTKMVPYINFPYAEHILKQLNQDPNGKATD